MPKRIVIRFPSGRPYDYYARVFWFAEALWDPIVNAGLGTLSDIDHPPNDVVAIDLLRNRHMADVKAIVKKSLQKFSLLNDATITVELLG
jgi:hypothetical protein